MSFPDSFPDERWEELRTTVVPELGRPEWEIVQGFWRPGQWMTRVLIDGVAAYVPPNSYGTESPGYPEDRRPAGTWQKLKWNTLRGYSRHVRPFAALEDYDIGSQSIDFRAWELAAHDQYCDYKDISKVPLDFFLEALPEDERPKLRAAFACSIMVKAFELPDTEENLSLTTAMEELAVLPNDWMLDKTLDYLCGRKEGVRFLRCTKRPEDQILADELEKENEALRNEAAKLFGQQVLISEVDNF